MGAFPPLSRSAVTASPDVVGRGRRGHAGRSHHVTHELRVSTEENRFVTLFPPGGQHQAPQGTLRGRTETERTAKRVAWRGHPHPETGTLQSRQIAFELVRGHLA